MAVLCGYMAKESSVQSPSFTKLCTVPGTLYTMMSSVPASKHHAGPVCTEFTVFDVFLKCPIRPHLARDLLEIHFVNKGRKQSIFRHGDLKIILKDSGFLVSPKAMWVNTIDRNSDHNWWERVSGVL